MRILNCVKFIPLYILVFITVLLIAPTNTMALRGNVYPYTTMTSNCLGGTVVKSKSISEGTFRLYKSPCGGFYAQFGSNGVRRTFTMEITNTYDYYFSSKKVFTNTYGGWTNLIPGGCVYATYWSNGQFKATLTNC